MQEVSKSNISLIKMLTLLFTESKGDITDNEFKNLMDDIAKDLSKFI